MAAGAGGSGRLRASDADRDRAVDVLKAAFVRGRLAKDEFDLRVGQVLTARTYADLDALTAGIPAGLPPHARPAATGARPGRRDLVPASPPGRSGTAALALIARAIARAAWARRRLISVAVGLLLFGAGLMLPSTVAFVAGILVMGSSAPPALPTPETAMVRTWRWLYQHQWLYQDQATH